MSDLEQQLITGEGEPTDKDLLTFLKEQAAAFIGGKRQEHQAEQQRLAEIEQDIARYETLLIRRNEMIAERDQHQTAINALQEQIATHQAAIQQIEPELQTQRGRVLNLASSLQDRGAATRISKLNTQYEPNTLS